MERSRLVYRRASRLRMSRRASFSLLGGLIAVVIAGVVLISFIAGISAYMKSANADQRCKMSFFIADQTSKLTEVNPVLDNTDIVPDIQCDRKTVTLEVKDVVRTPRGKIDDTMFKQKIADEVRRCWSLVGEGKMNPFRFKTYAFDKTYCMICAKIQVSDDLKEKMEAENYVPSQFNYYLALTRMPGSDKYFYEYLFRSIPSPEQLKALQAQKDILYVKDNPLYVAWRLTIEDRRLTEHLTVANCVLNPLGCPSTFVGAQLYAGNQSGEVYVSQGVLWAPSILFSGKASFSGETADKDVCTTMIN